MLDASARRFQAHKIYLKAAAARRWVMSRTQALQGRKPNGRHTEGLNAANEALRSVRDLSAYQEPANRQVANPNGLLQDLSEVTDTHVMNDLRAADQRAGYWLSEDPSLNKILDWIRSRG
jgi:hypothetical protein